VLTHSDQPLEWEHSPRLSGDPAEAVAELKRSEGRDLLIQGSSTLYAPLLAAGLIDRLILMIFPVMLGRGKTIFDGSQAAEALKLTSHSVSDKGVVFLDYRPGGEVPTGSFATKEPSEDELKLREAIREGSW
jgi:dihydrofolate reductase